MQSEDDSVISAYPFFTPAFFRIRIHVFRDASSMTEPKLQLRSKKVVQSGVSFRISWGRSDSTEDSKKMDSL